MAEADGAVEPLPVAQPLLILGSRKMKTDGLCPVWVDHYNKAVLWRFELRKEYCLLESI